MTVGCVLWAKCYPCQFGDHFDPPQVHTWMDEEDYEHALNTGQVTSETDLARERRCACHCAEDQS